MHSLNPDLGLGVVVIGRNEGERLTACLRSITRAAPGVPVVYVDSNSTDTSVASARRLQADVVELDGRKPFTAAWARNTGWRRLLEIAPATTRVHFLDGDCELIDGWIGGAMRFLDERTDVAVVCGRRRERFPDATPFNAQCDVEWNTAVGQARSCGGDALMRIEALRAVNGYNESLIAGEEPELCVRIRAAGGKIWRLDHDMVWHDAAMRSWSQWWRRTKRAGHAFAEGAALHGEPPERHYVPERRRALIWGGLLPLFIVAAGMVDAHAFWLAMAYPIQVVRLGLRPSPAAKQAGVVWSRAFFLVAGRFAEAAGVLLYSWRRLRGHASTLIEYK